jgi:fructokinase
MTATNARIGIDLGGSKIEIIVLGDDGATLWRERCATPQGDYTSTVQAIAALVAEASAKLSRGGTASPSGTALHPQSPVGVGIPGAESLATGLIKNANSTCLIGQPLRADLETALGRPVRLANDANCFALSEAVDGAAAGAPVVFGVILGTGVGGGIVVDGKVLPGTNAIAGEWGHNPLPGEGEGRACYCGRRDCIETYLSGPALEGELSRPREECRPQGGCHPTATDFRVPQIVASAEQGDAACEDALCRYEQRLARALAGVINLLDPDVIVLGGGLSNVRRLYQNVPRLWLPHVFSDTVATRLVPNRHGDSSGVRGAAWLFP